MSVSTADIARVIDGVPKGLLINGKQIQTGSTVKVEDPSTGETLAEVADASPEQGIEALEELLRELEPGTADLEALCDRLLGQMIGDQPEDDVALLVVRWNPETVA